MSHTPNFDVEAAHKWFAAEFFNRTWTLLERDDRTSADDEAMLALCHASLAHWRERGDCLPRNLSVAYWLLSRVYAALDQAATAWHYAGLSLVHSDGEAPFYVGYAREALCRAAQLGNDFATAQTHLEEAWRLSALVSDEQEREMLESDLRQLQALVS